MTKKLTHFENLPLRIPPLLSSLIAAALLMVIVVDVFIVKLCVCVGVLEDGDGGTY